MRAVALLMFTALLAAGCVKDRGRGAPAAPKVQEYPAPAAKS